MTGNERASERALRGVARPARMPFARQKGQRTSGEPRAVHESVVPEASIGALAKNSRARLRRYFKEGSMAEGVRIGDKGREERGSGTA